MHPLVNIFPPVPVALDEKEYFHSLKKADYLGCQQYGIRLSNGELLRDFDNDALIIRVHEGVIDMLTEMSGSKRKKNVVPLTDDYPNHPYVSSPSLQTGWLSAIKLLFDVTSYGSTAHWLESNPKFHQKILSSVNESETVSRIYPRSIDDI